MRSTQVPCECEYETALGERLIGQSGLPWQGQITYPNANSHPFFLDDMNSRKVLRSFYLKVARFFSFFPRGL